MISSEESDSFSWCDERLLLASTIAQHGFCFYAKSISSVGSNVGCVRVDVDMASEMLANTNNMMALGKLVGQGMRTSNTSYGGRNSEISQPNAVTRYCSLAGRICCCILYQMLVKDVLQLHIYYLE